MPEPLATQPVLLTLRLRGIACHQRRNRFSSTPVRVQPIADNCVSGTVDMGDLADANVTLTFSALGEVHPPQGAPDDLPPGGAWGRYLIETQLDEGGHCDR